MITLSGADLSQVSLNESLETSGSDIFNIGHDYDLILKMRNSLGLSLDEIERQMKLNFEKSGPDDYTVPMIL